MPEGPEIRRAADRIEKAIRDRELVSVTLDFEPLRGLEEVLEGETVTGITTHGKAMLTHFSGGLTLYSHNQLYGVWKIARKADPKTNRRLRVALRTEGAAALLYSATDVDVLDADGVAGHPFLRKLGPDALWESTDVDEVDERLQSKTFSGRSLGALLLDQSFVAGLGNYLRSEILFCASLRPEQRPRDLTRGQRRKVARETLKLTRRSYETAGVTLPASVVPARRKGQRRERFWVFARQGKRCRRCDDSIEKIVVGSRRLYLCPTCQSV
ncbi:MAG: endonuclease VIII [Acidobacteriota bacterium]